MFTIKICGLTGAADAQAAVQAGADAIGLNFYEGSPRRVRQESAEQIVESLPSGAIKVGVFVNSTAEFVLRTCDRLQLDLIQIHGDEPPEFLAELSGKPVMRALRCSADGLPRVLSYLEACRDLRAMPRYLLLDAHHHGGYGGTGQLADWPAAREYRQRLRSSGSDLPQLVLAGGLNPENVAEAIAAVQPSAIDAASGVESSPGRKCSAKMQAFAAAAREALSRLS